MRLFHIAVAVVVPLSCVFLNASCVQSRRGMPEPEGVGGHVPAIETTDDGDPFGSDPDVGGDIGSDPPASDPGSSSWSTPNEPSEPGDSSNEEGVHLFKTVTCSPDEYGATCMGRCAEEAGIGCMGGRNHPKKRDGGLGLLGQCSDTLGLTSCSYYYANGDKCVFRTARPPICVYEGGTR